MPTPAWWAMSLSVTSAPKPASSPAATCSWTAASSPRCAPAAGVWPPNATTPGHDHGLHEPRNLRAEGQPHRAGLHELRHAPRGDALDARRGRRATDLPPNAPTPRSLL